MKNDLNALIPLEKLKKVLADLVAVPKAEVDQLESERPKKIYKKPFDTRAKVPKQDRK